MPKTFTNWKTEPIWHLLFNGKKNGGTVCFILHNHHHHPSSTIAKTRSRHSYGPAVFASSQHGPCIKSTTLAGFLFSLWQTIIHFRWYLHDFEAMNSQFYPCLASMCNTRVWKKKNACLSTWRPSQPVSSTCLRYPNPQGQRNIISVAWRLTSHPTPPQPAPTSSVTSSA